MYCDLDAFLHRHPRRASCHSTSRVVVVVVVKYIRVCGRAQGGMVFFFLFRPLPWLFFPTASYIHTMIPSTWINPNHRPGKLEYTTSSKLPSDSRRKIRFGRAKNLSLPPLSLSHYRMVSSQIESSDLCVSDLSAVRPAAERRSLGTAPLHLLGIASAWGGEG